MSSARRQPRPARGAGLRAQLAASAAREAVLWKALVEIFGAHSADCPSYCANKHVHGVARRAIEEFYAGSYADELVAALRARAAHVAALKDLAYLWSGFDTYAALTGPLPEKP